MIRVQVNPKFLNLICKHVIEFCPKNEHVVVRDCKMDRPTSFQSNLNLIGRFRVIFYFFFAPGRALIFESEPCFESGDLDLYKINSFNFI